MIRYGVLKNYKEKLRRWISSYYLPQGVIIAHRNYNVDINCAEARYSNLQGNSVLGIWGSKLSIDSLSRSLIDPPVYDLRLELNSARWVSKLSYTRACETLMHTRSRSLARVKFYFGFYFRYRYQRFIKEVSGTPGSFPAWQIFTLFGSVHNLHFPG